VTELINVPRYAIEREREGITFIKNRKKIVFNLRYE
jgi:hypothetical protein